MTPLSPVLSIFPFFCLSLHPCSLLLFVKTGRQWAFVLWVRWRPWGGGGGRGRMVISLRQGVGGGDPGREAGRQRPKGEGRGCVWCQTG